jgi:hypothetical protein
LAAVERKLGAHPALAAGADPFVELFCLNRDADGRFVIYTFGLYLKGLKDEETKSAAGIWFGQESQL